MALSGRLHIVVRWPEPTSATTIIINVMADSFRSWIRGRKGGEVRAPSADALLPDVINQSGRAPLAYFLELAAVCDEAAFAARLRCPLLVGRAIKEGSLASEERGDALEQMRGKTMAFRPAQLFAMARQASRPSESLQEAVYPLTKGPLSASADILKYDIGRAVGNDFVIPDFAISKQHARIELTHHEYYIRDLGSRNGTFVNGKAVRERTRIAVRDTICLARYEFAFVSPELLYRLLVKRALQSASKR